MHGRTDLHRVLGALHQARTALDLDRAHLCYLIACFVADETLTRESLVLLVRALPGESPFHPPASQRPHARGDEAEHAVEASQTEERAT